MLWVVALVVMAVGFSACQKPAPARYVWRAGEPLDYKLWLTQQVEINGDRERAQRVMVRFVLRFEPREAAADGSARLAVVVREAQATLSTSEGRQPLDQMTKLAGLSFAMSLRPDGAIEALDAAGETIEAMAPTVDSLKRTLRELFPTLPERLTPGTAWTRRVGVTETIPPYGALPAETVTSFEAGESAKIDGEEAVAINAHFSLSLGDGAPRTVSRPAEPSFAEAGAGERPPQAAAEERVVIKGQGDGKGAFYFSPQRGRLVSATYETALTIVQTREQFGKTDSTTQTVRSRIELRPLDAAAPRTSEEKQP